MLDALGEELLPSHQGRHLIGVPNKSLQLTRLSAEFLKMP